MNKPYVIELNGKLTLLYPEDLLALIRDALGPDAERLVRGILDECDTLQEENSQLADKLFRLED